MLKRIGLVLGILVASAAVIAQTFPNFPVLGGAAYCAAFGNAGVCTSTIPAGPAMSGQETYPADTNATQGRTQTVKVPAALIGAMPVVYNLVVAGSASYTYTMDNFTGTVIWDIASGAISSANTTLPPSPIDGQTVAINSKTTLTAMTVSPVATQNLAATTPTALTASATAVQGYKFLYRASNKTWYRIQ